MDISKTYWMIGRTFDFWFIASIFIWVFFCVLVRLVETVISFVWMQYAYIFGVQRFTNKRAQSHVAAVVFFFLLLVCSQAERNGKGKTKQRRSKKKRTAHIVKIEPNQYNTSWAPLIWLRWRRIERKWVVWYTLGRREKNCRNQRTDWNIVFPCCNSTSCRLPLCPAFTRPS